MMKAIVSNNQFSLDDGNQFSEIDIPQPEPGEGEILIKVETLSVNPVDTKLRQQPFSDEEKHRILGYDAVGTIEKIGNNVSTFKKGDRVFYSGAPSYAGANQQYQLMDVRLVAHAPQSLKPTEAAALPLTGLTAYETLFDTFNISENPQENRGKTLLIINGSGGVGSIATQIAKAYGLRVITTASRTETIEWSKQMGADLVLNHKNDLSDEFKKHDLADVDYIFCTFNTDAYYEKMIELVKPHGKITTIVAFQDKQDLNLLKSKSVTFTHEFMFTRPLHQTEDMQKHQTYLQDIAQKVDDGVYHTTLNQTLNGLTTETLFKAHEILESHKMIGKLVIQVDEDSEN